MRRWTDARRPITEQFYTRTRCVAVMSLFRCEPPSCWQTMHRVCVCASRSLAAGDMDSLALYNHYQVVPAEGMMMR